MDQSTSSSLEQTPGPWRIVLSQGRETGQIWADNPPAYVADVWTSNADTHLIGAAPELLETARWAVDLIEMYDAFLIRLGQPPEKVHSETHIAGLQRAHAIIAKAEAGHP